MEKITFTCETITPMFLSGADGVTPELRPPSIKGALRFWWRAMNGHLSLEDLKTKEDEIFGGTDGRSKVIIQKVTCNDFIPSYEEFNQIFYTYDGNSRRDKNKAFPTNAMYYLGYGVANWVKEEKKTRFLKPYIPTGTNFSVTLKVQKQFEKQMITTFKALEQFGGLGSKTRNAYGCFRIIKTYLNDNEINNSNIILKNNFDNELKEHTSLSNKISLFETNKKDFKTWEEAFKNICIAYQYARENIDNWHDYNMRELIALPIVVKGEREMKDNFLERHSKPYFMHISKTPQGYKGEILLMPYKYLEYCEEVDVSRIEEFRGDYFVAIDNFNNLLKDKMNVLIEKKLSE